MVGKLNNNFKVINYIKIHLDIKEVYNNNSF